MVITTTWGAIVSIYYNANSDQRTGGNTLQDKVIYLKSDTDEEGPDLGFVLRYSIFCVYC